MNIDNATLSVHQDDGDADSPGAAGASGFRVVIIVWAVLTTVTVISWILGSAHGVSGDRLPLAMATVLLIAFAKVDLVGRYFMELRAAPLLLRFVFDAWVAATFVVVLALYLGSR
jgi:Prokaryotic Cytochrome C oxidase subunit IV